MNPMDKEQIKDLVLKLYWQVDSFLASINTNWWGVYSNLHNASLNVRDLHETYRASTYERWDMSDQLLTDYTYGLSY